MPTRIPIITTPVKVHTIPKIRAGMDLGDRSPYLQNNKENRKYDNCTFLKYFIANESPRVINDRIEEKNFFFFNNIEKIFTGFVKIRYRKYLPEQTIVYGM